MGIGSYSGSIVQRGAADSRHDIVQRCEYDVDPRVRFGNKSDQVIGADKRREDDQRERHTALEFEVVASERPERNNRHRDVEESNLALPSSG